MLARILMSAYRSEAETFMKWAGMWAERLSACTSSRRNTLLIHQLDE